MVPASGLGLSRLVADGSAHPGTSALLSLAILSRVYNGVDANTMTDLGIKYIKFDPIWIL